MIAMVAAGTASFADGIVRAGIAESGESFAIGRNSSTIEAPADTLTEILPGDQLRTELDRVTVRLPEDNLVVLNGRTSAVMETMETVRLEKGALVAGFGGSAPVFVAVDELVISPLARKKTGIVPIAGGGFGQAVLVEHSSADVVKVAVANGMATVRDATGQQLAAIAPGEIVSFVRNSAGQWLIDPTRQFLSQIGTTIPPPQAVQEVTDEQLIGGFWWWFGGAAVGGGTAAYLLLDDDDGGDGGDDDDDRPRISPR